MGRVLESFGGFRGWKSWRLAQGGNVLLQVPANDVIDGCASFLKTWRLTPFFILGFFLDGSFKSVLLAIRSFHCFLSELLLS
jgi:hypothetical protein